MLNWNDYLKEDQRRQDERTAAAQWRLSQHVMRAGQAQRQPLLARLGAWLILWGCRLQTRYARPAQPAATVSLAGEHQIRVATCSG